MSNLTHEPLMGKFLDANGINQNSSESFTSIALQSIKEDDYAVVEESETNPESNVVRKFDNPGDCYDYFNNSCNALEEETLLNDSLSIVYPNSYFVMYDDEHIDLEQSFERNNVAVLYNGSKVVKKLTIVNEEYGYHR